MNTHRETENGTRQRRRSGAGFTLIEICLIVTIVAIVASIATPRVVRARGAAAEAATISSLRVIHSAQFAFASTCAGGSYAPSIAWLTRTSKTARYAFLGPGFVGTTTVDSQGYRLRLTVGPKVATAPPSCNGLGKGQAVNGYFLAADPLQLAGGISRHFGIDANGVIYESPNAIRPILTGRPPLPARPIQ